MEGLEAWDVGRYKIIEDVVYTHAANAYTIPAPTTAIPTTASVLKMSMV